MYGIELCGAFYANYRSSKTMFFVESFVKRWMSITRPKEKTFILRGFYADHTRRKVLTRGLCITPYSKHFFYFVFYCGVRRFWDKFFWQYVTLRVLLIWKQKSDYVCVIKNVFGAIILLILCASHVVGFWCKLEFFHDGVQHDRIQMT